MDREPMKFRGLQIPGKFNSRAIAMASSSLQTTFCREAAHHSHIRTHRQIRAQSHSHLVVFAEDPSPISRRCAVLFISMAPLTSLLPLPAAKARERRNRKSIQLEDYLTGPDGLKYYDIEVGKGLVAEEGSTVQVHFDCVYRNITAVSSRESKLLAGNRTIAQPYEFKVGSPPGKERKRDFVDNPNGLFSAQAAPKPPPAMYKITEGMRVGGKRTVVVPPEAGYGQKGMNEIPAGATFNLNIELLQVTPPEQQ